MQQSYGAQAEEKKQAHTQKTKAHKFEEFSASSRQHEKQPSLLLCKMHLLSRNSIFR